MIKHLRNVLNDIVKIMKKTFKKNWSSNVKWKKHQNKTKKCSTKHRTKDMVKFPYKSAGKKNVAGRLCTVSWSQSMSSLNGNSQPSAITTWSCLYRV